MSSWTKNELRERLRGYDYSTPPLYLPVGITNHFKTIFTFLSTQKEQSTKYINDQLMTDTQHNPDLIVAAPRIEGRSLSFYSLSPSTQLKENKYSIFEPPTSSPRMWPQSNPEGLGLPLLILVPGLAFTESGERLGRGGGYYDRFLQDVLTRYAQKRASVILAGVCVQAQIIEDIPTEEHDQRVDCLITENGYIICNKEMKTVWEKYVQQ